MHWWANFNNFYKINTVKHVVNEWILCKITIYCLYILHSIYFFATCEFCLKRTTYGQETLLLLDHRLSLYYYYIIVHFVAYLFTLYTKLSFVMIAAVVYHAELDQFCICTVMKFCVQMKINRWISFGVLRIVWLECFAWP